MPVEPEGFTKDLIRIIKAFASGELTSEEFNRKHKIKEREKWEEMRFIARDNFLLNTFIRKLTIGSRFKALKEVQGLTEENIKDMGFTSGIQRYFKGDLHEEISTSFFYYELAIVLDAPVEFLILENPIERNANINSFWEYQKVCTKLSYMKELCEVTITPPKCRIVKGYRVENINPMLFSYRREIIVRVDKHINYFCFEVFIDSIIGINKDSINNIKQMLQGKIKYVFVSDALLRDQYKITFFGTYKNSIYENQILDEYIDEFQLRFRSKKN